MKQRFFRTATATPRLKPALFTHPLFSLCLAALLTSPLWFPAGAGASWFGLNDSDDNEPITPIQYAGLLGLRDIDPALFRETLLPLIAEAMKDGKITAGELKAIEKAAGNVAPAFYRAAREPRLQESLDEALAGAKKSGGELGAKLGDTLNNELPKLFDDAVRLFREQMGQFNKNNPEPPTKL